MEIPQSPNSNELEDAPDASPQQPGPKKRRRIPYNPANIVLSSEQFKAEASGILDLEADSTEEDFFLQGDLDEAADELPGNDHFLDDNDLDEDQLQAEPGRRAGSGSDLDATDDDLDYAGAGLPQDDEDSDFFGLPDEEAGNFDHDEDIS